MGDEDTTTEAMLINVLSESGWKYVPQDELRREYSDVINVYRSYKMFVETLPRLAVRQWLQIMSVEFLSV